MLPSNYKSNQNFIKASEPRESMEAKEKTSLLNFGSFSYLRIDMPLSLSSNTLKGNDSSLFNEFKDIMNQIQATNNKEVKDEDIQDIIVQVDLLIGYKFSLCLLNEIFKYLRAHLLSSFPAQVEVAIGLIDYLFRNNLDEVFHLVDQRNFMRTLCDVGRRHNDIKNAKSQRVALRIFQAVQSWAESFLSFKEESRQNYSERILTSHIWDYYLKLRNKYHIKFENTTRNSVGKTIIMSASSTESTGDLGIEDSNVALLGSDLKSLSDLSRRDSSSLSDDSKLSMEARIDDSHSVDTFADSKMLVDNSDQQSDVMSFQFEDIHPSDSDRDRSLYDPFATKVMNFIKMTKGQKAIQRKEFGAGEFKDARSESAINTVSTPRENSASTFPARKQEGLSVLHSKQMDKNSGVPAMADVQNERSKFSRASMEQQISSISHPTFPDKDYILTTNRAPAKNASFTNKTKKELDADFSHVANIREKWKKQEVCKVSPTPSARSNREDFQPLSRVDRYSAEKKIHTLRTKGVAAKGRSATPIKKESRVSTRS